MKKKEKSRKDYFFIFIGSAFGTGLAPIAPGTIAALTGVLFHVLIVKLFPETIQQISITMLFILVCAANNLLTLWAQKYWQSKDPKNFVLDEVAGYLLIPVLFDKGELWKAVCLGFLLFRVLDIFKLIPPAKQIDEKMHGAWGILLDDLVSSGYAVLIMYFLYWYGPDWILHAT